MMSFLLVIGSLPLVKRDAYFIKEIYRLKRIGVFRLGSNTIFIYIASIF